ncbi:stage III sporulation protein SpoIIIAB [Clostridium sp. AL.422]|uniref:stage III sporulation protein SpoIIIAB n=1 Tax=Clostridium TaxID=1485 RepID=UPI00293DB426|nr:MULTISPECIES: stage III sporulation protein SpoIIIAB [unclassified Clostridium]MDV4152172.1 stage III sporulation protein SpoIIIAB [Clostridium sp. AL.422]
MLKIIAITIIFLSSTYIGFYYGESFKRRSKNLKSVLKAVMFLNNEVIYSNTPLPEALNYVSMKLDDPIGNILSNVARNLESGQSKNVYDAFKEEYNENKSNLNLFEEDKMIIKDFIRGLGESGVYGQDKLFNITIENMKINCNAADELAKKNSKMYSAIGVCIGAMIGIFLF